MHPLAMLVSNAAAVPADAAVVWIGDSPGDDQARLVADALGEPRAARYAVLVERVAERLFRRDLATVGAVADLGFFRPFYLAHARRIVTALDGTLLRITRPA